MASLPKSPAPSTKTTTQRASMKKLAPKFSLTRESRVLSVSEAKTHLLAVLSEIETVHKAVTITRRGRAVAQIIPMADGKRPSGFGCMKGTATIIGDIVSPDHEAWGVQS